MTRKMKPEMEFLPTIKEKLDEWKEKERYRKPFKKADFAKGLDETLSVILDKVPKKDSIFISGEWDNTLLGIFKIKSRLDYYFWGRGIIDNLQKFKRYSL